MKSNKTQSRRDFIGAMGVTGATLGLALLPKSVKAEGKGLSELSSFIDVSEEATAEKWIQSFQQKKFGVVYDQHEVKDGWAQIWSNIYAATNSGVANLGIAVVMRHGAFPLALSDKMWEKYKLGEFFKIIDKNTGAPSVRNIYWEPTGKDFPLPGLDGIKGLIQKGTAHCVCNMALKVYSGSIAAANGLSGEEVYKDFVANMVPGVQLVPSGVWALGRFQDKSVGFGYINAG